MAQITPGNVLGGYRLVEQLGAGGMGEVWKARNVRVERMERAVKVIRVDVAEHEEYRARFLREAEVLEQLQHPNILQVYDLGEQDGVLFLTMELLRGRSVDVVLRDGPMAFEKIRDIAAQALAGIAHAHGVGIIHRDLKPANLFLQDDGVVKVLDFGIARGGAGTGSLTGTGLAPGSPAYFAPEFADGAQAAPASDVYSMGITLFQMITGRLPFDAGGGTPSAASISLLIQHVTKPLPDIRTMRPGIPDDLVQAVARATAKKPIDRPSATELAAIVSGKAAAAAAPRPATPVPRAPAPSAGMSADDVGAMTMPQRGRGVRPTPAPPPPSRRGWIAAAAVAALAAVAIPVGVHFAGAKAGSTATPTPVAATSPAVATSPTALAAVTASAAPATSPETAASAVAVSTPTAKPHVTPTPHTTAKTHPTQVAMIATPKATPPPVAGDGFLTVFADPWCQVYVDGKLVAEETPLKHFKLPAGSHHVTFANPDKIFELKETRTVEISAGGEAKFLVDVKAKTVKPQ